MFKLSFIVVVFRMIHKKKLFRRSNVKYWAFSEGPAWINLSLCSYSPDTIFWLHSGDKTWYEFLVTSGCLVSRKVWWVSEVVAFSQNWGTLQTRMDQRGDHIKMNFDYFQIRKWMLQTVREQLEKNGVIFLVSMFSSRVMVCKLYKKLHFLQFYADLSKKS